MSNTLPLIHHAGRLDEAQEALCEGASLDLSQIESVDLAAAESAIENLLNSIRNCSKRSLRENAFSALSNLPRVEIAKVGDLLLERAEPKELGKIGALLASEIKRSEKRVELGKSVPIDLIHTLLPLLKWGVKSAPSASGCAAALAGIAIVPSLGGERNIFRTQALESLTSRLDQTVGNFQCAKRLGTIAIEAKDWCAEKAFSELVKGLFGESIKAHAACADGLLTSLEKLENRPGNEDAKGDLQGKIYAALDENISSLAAGMRKRRGWSCAFAVIALLNSDNAEHRERAAQVIVDYIGEREFVCNNGRGSGYINLQGCFDGRVTHTTELIEKLLPNIRTSDRGFYNPILKACGLPKDKNGWSVIENYLDADTTENRDAVIDLLFEQAKVIRYAHPRQPADRCAYLLDLVEERLRDRTGLDCSNEVEALAEIMIYAHSQGFEEIEKYSRNIYESLPAGARLKFLTGLDEKRWSENASVIWKDLAGLVLRGEDPQIHPSRLISAVLERNRVYGMNYYIGRMRYYLESATLETRIDCWRINCKDSSFRACFESRDFAQFFSQEFLKCGLEHSNLNELADMGYSWGTALEDRLKSKNFAGARELLQPIEHYLKSHGLEPSDFLRIDESSSQLAGAWIVSAPPALRIINILTNLRTIKELDQARTGSAQILRERFGIKVFGRYPTDMLQDQLNWIRQRRLTPPPEYIAVFNPVSDHNGAFFRNPHIIAAYHSAKKEGVPFIVSEAGTPRGFLKQMARRRFEFGKMTACLIAGHGSEDTRQIELDIKENLEASGLRDKAVSHFLNELFQDQAKLVLQSCHVGAPNGFAHTVVGTFRQRAVTVYCTSSATSLSSLLISRNGNGGKIAISGKFGSLDYETRTVESHSFHDKTIEQHDKRVIDRHIKKLCSDPGASVSKEVLQRFYSKMRSGASVYGTFIPEGLLPREMERIIFAAAGPTNSPQFESFEPYKFSPEKELARSLLSCLCPKYLPEGRALRPQDIPNAKVHAAWRSFDPSSPSEIIITTLVSFTEEWVEHPESPHNHYTIPNYNSVHPSITGKPDPFTLRSSGEFAGIVVRSKLISPVTSITASDKSSPIVIRPAAYELCIPRSAFLREVALFTTDRAAGYFTPLIQSMSAIRIAAALSERRGTAVRASDLLGEGIDVSKLKFVPCAIEELVFCSGEHIRLQAKNLMGRLQVDFRWDPVDWSVGWDPFVI